MNSAASKAVLKINNVLGGDANAKSAFNGPISAGSQSRRPSDCNSLQLRGGRHLFRLDIGPRTLYGMNENKVICFSG